MFILCLLHQRNQTFTLIIVLTITASSHCTVCVNSIVTPMCKIVNRTHTRTHTQTQSIPSLTGCHVENGQKLCDHLQSCYFTDPRVGGAFQVKAGLQEHN